MASSIDITTIIIAVLGTAIGLLILVKILQDVDFGIWLMILLFPFTRLRIIDTPFGSLQPSQLLVILTLISLLLRGAVKKERLKIDALPVNAALLVFLLVCLFSLVQFISFDFAGTSAMMPYTRPGRVDPIIRALTSILNILIGFATFYLIINRLRTEKAIKKGIVCWLASGLMASLFGIYAFSTNLIKLLPPLPDFLTGGQGGIVARELDLINPAGSPLMPRVASVLQEPRHLAIFLAPIVFFSLCLFRKKVYLLRPGAQITITILTMFAFVLTLSRMTLVLALTIFVMYLFAGKVPAKSSAQPRIQPLFLLVLIFLVVLATNVLLDHFFKVDLIEFSILQWASVVGGSHLTYYAEQMASFKTAWRAFFDHPFIGGGIGSFYYFVKLYGVKIRSSVVNNVYLEIMAELGLLGITAFLAVIFSFFRSLNISDGQLDSTQAKLIAGFKGSFLILLVGYLFYSAFFYPFVWGLMGLAVACRTNWGNRCE